MKLFFGKMKSSFTVMSNSCLNPANAVCVQLTMIVFELLTAVWDYHRGHDFDPVTNERANHAFLSMHCLKLSKQKIISIKSPLCISCISVGLMLQWIYGGWHRYNIKYKLQLPWQLPGLKLSRRARLSFSSPSALKEKKSCSHKHRLSLAPFSNWLLTR